MAILKIRLRAEWDYLALPFWRRLFGTELFWRWVVLAPADICLIATTHMSLSLKLCAFHVARMFSKETTVFLKKATSVVRSS